MLKANYKAFLHQLQPSIPVSDSLKCEFVDDFEKSQNLVNCFNINLEQEGIDQLIGNDCAVDNPLFKIQEHLGILEKADAYLHSLFTLAVNIVFCGGSSHAVGGTTSGAI